MGWHCPIYVNCNLTNINTIILTVAQISVANSKVFCKLGNGAVRDLTLDTNTVYTHPSAIQCDASSEIESLKSSVSNGKTLIANAITGKGVATSSSDTFATMANNINQISTTSTPLQWSSYRDYLNDGSYIDASSIFGKSVTLLGVIVERRAVLAAWLYSYNGATNGIMSGVTITVNGNNAYFHMQSSVQGVTLHILATAL